MKILFVEDNAVDAAVTAAAIMLAQPLSRIDIAYTFEEAQRRLDSLDAYGLVLLDLNLPDGSGIELLRRLRKRCDATPVAVLTGADSVEDAQAALKAGADRYIVKRHHYLRDLPAQLLQTRRRVRRLGAELSPALQVLALGCRDSELRVFADHAALASPLLEWQACADVEQLARLASPVAVVLIDADDCAVRLDAIIACCAEHELPAVLITSGGSAALAAQATVLCSSEWLTKGEGLVERLPLLLELAHQRAALAREKSALQTAVSRLDHLLSTNPTILYSLRPSRDGYVVSWVSANVEAILGYAPDEVTAPGWWLAALHPADRARVCELVSQMPLRAEDDIEYRLICRDGQTRRLRDQRRVLFDDDGAVIEVVGSWNDVTAHRDREQRIAQLSQYDPLTGLLNRWAFESNLTQALVGNDTAERVVGVLLIDLVGLKSINGSFGIQAGDNLLCEVARRITAWLAGRGVAARTSGDEFAVLLTLPDADAFVATAHTLAAAIAAAVAVGDGLTLNIHCCTGIALADASSTAATLLQQADSALNEAKQQGKGTVTLYDACLSEATRQRLQLAARLRLAIENQQIVVWYQPKADMRSGRIIGVEALARWFDDELGTVPPDIFIDVAEEYGLIHALGALVCRQACTQLAQWLRQGVLPLQLAINLSPLQLERDELVTDIAAILDECGLASIALQLELTETALMRDYAHTTRLLNALKEHGIGLALDDFGKGYSALGYLSHLPLDVIKIDKEFVSGVPTNRHATAITQAVVQLGHALGYAVLAEGVETIQQLDHLRALGCDAYQGFLLSRPLPAAECGELLLAQTPRTPGDRP